MAEYYLAVDIGASSGRHILGHLEDGRIVLEEVYRFENGMEKKDGHLCWNLPRLFHEIKEGLKACRAAGKIPKSMGIDTWAVDYVLLDGEDRILGNTYGYRDGRTKGMDKEVYKIIPEDALYARTGIQKQMFNTIYQLMAVKTQEPENMEKAEWLLMLPDYFHFLLTGNKLSEYTNATSTQLVSPETKQWDYELIERLGYKSTPVVGFHALAQSLLDEGYTLFGVPGFYRDKDGRWTMAVWRRGILIPGTYFGKIQGFQIRLDHKMKKGGKFLTFSSRDELDGAMGENWCHMVGPVRERILLIEGYMKADIVNHFTGQTMLAIPGVTSLQHLESALRDLIPMGVRHIMTCFDMDYLKNWHVESAYQNLVELLAKQNVTFGTYLWVPDYNGLDDYIWEFCMNKGNPPK